MDDNELKKYKSQLESYNKAVKKMDVSYGVDKKEDDEEVAEIEISKAVEPKKSKGLIEEIEEMKANGMTGTDEFREKQKKLEQILLGYKSIASLETVRASSSLFKFFKHSILVIKSSKLLSDKKFSAISEYSVANL